MSESGIPIEEEVFKDLNTEPEDPEAAPPQISVTLPELVEANYQAIKVVFAAAIAQIMGGDPLTARKLFTQLENDVEEQRNHYLQLAQAARESIEEVQAEVVEGEIE